MIGFKKGDLAFVEDREEDATVVSVKRVKGQSGYVHEFVKVRFKDGETAVYPAVSLGRTIR